MTSTTFDTLETAAELEAAGASRSLAEAFSKAIRRSRDSDTSDLATKADLEKLDTGLRHEIKNVRHEMKQLEQRMTIRLGLMMVATVSIAATIVKLLQHP